MMTCFLLIVLQPFQQVERTIFEFQFIEGRQITQAKLALHFLNNEQFSLHLSKSPAGTLLLYWATPERDVLTFPKQSKSFVGAAGEPFALFANGPRLTRGEWLNLLQKGNAKDLGLWEIYKMGEWFSLTDPDRTFRIRWTETSRIVRPNVHERVLQPDPQSLQAAEPLVALIGFEWTDH